MNILHFSFSMFANLHNRCAADYRNSDRLGNGVLYASVNPEYFSAAESKRISHSLPFPMFG